MSSDPLRVRVRGTKLAIVVPDQLPSSRRELVHGEPLESIAGTVVHGTEHRRFAHPVLEVSRTRAGCSADARSRISGSFVALLRSIVP